MGSVNQPDARQFLRPYTGRGLFVTATGTDTGKTTVTAALAGALRASGMRVGICKPLASGCPTFAANQPGAVTEDFRSPDVEITLRAAGLDPSNHEILNQASPVRFGQAVSPHLAARLENRAVDWARIAAALGYWQKHSDFLLVEGAGGWEVPLDAHDFTIADLATRLGLPVLLVTDASLGILNVAVLTVRAIQARGLTVAGLVVNHVPEPLDLVARENLNELPRLCGVPLLAALPQVADELTQVVPPQLIRLMEPFAGMLNHSPE